MTNSVSTTANAENEGVVDTDHDRTLAVAPISIIALFTAFTSTLPHLLEAERDLCGYSGQDPAVDRWITAADLSLAATKAACAAVLAAPVTSVAGRNAQRVAKLFMDVIASTDPDEVADLRATARLRRWAYRVPTDLAGAGQINAQIDGALDALELWLALEDPFDARAEAWAALDLDSDAGPAPSA